LTPILQAQSWLDALSSLRIHGRGDQIESLCRSHSSNSIQDFGKAVANFADGLCTLRVADTIETTSVALLDSIDQSSGELIHAFPILQEEVGALKAMVSPLVAEDIYTKEGVSAWSNFARLCFRLQRFAEAVAVVREGYVVASIALLQSWGVTDVRWLEPVSFDGARCANYPAGILPRKNVSLHIGDTELLLSDLGLETAKISAIRKLIGMKLEAGGLRNDVLHCGLRRKGTASPNPAASSVRDKAASAVDGFVEFHSQLVWLPIGV
jgi:hypothetical protein